MEIFAGLILRDNPLLEMNRKKIITSLLLLRSLLSAMISCIHLAALFSNAP